MKKCQYCYYTNDDNAQYCSRCGKAFGTDTVINNILFGLNQRSSSNDIYDALKKILRIITESVSKDDKTPRDRYTQSISKAPVHTLTQDGLEWWSLLNKAEYELLDIRTASSVLVQFLLALLMASYVELNHKEYKKAGDRIFNEVINDCMEFQVTTVDKLGSTILKLHSTFATTVSHYG